VGATPSATAPGMAGHPRVDPSLNEYPTHHPESSPRVAVVRHGATAWSRALRHTGRTDVPLSDEGRRQAVELGRRLAGHDFDRVLTSPLLRARETCELAGFGARARLCDDLVEWDYGEYEGRTTAEIRRRRAQWVLWRDGAPGGESPDEVARRVDRVIALVRAVPDEVLVFAHGHVLRVLASRWIGLEPHVGGSLALDPATLSALGYERGVPVLLRWNIAGSDPLS
jgi:broad specificity phosphatase PhoE